MQTYVQLSSLWQIGLIIIPFIISAMMAPRIVALCKAKQIIDVANERSSHTTPTPRGGGLGIVLCALPLMALAVWWFKLPNLSFWLSLGAGSLVIALLGWYDDKLNLPAGLRFTVQALCVATGLYFIPAVFNTYAPLWLEKSILFLAWMWFLNLYNFMDGIDGFATSEATFISIALSIINPILQPLGLILGGVTIGFLRVNWSPAKIFMGDIGSTFLGFVLAGLLIFSLNESNAIALFILPLVFTADATYTLIKRMLCGKKFWQAHREHFYQRAVRSYLSHSQVVTRAMAINAILFILAVLATIGSFSILALLLATILMAFAGWRIYSSEK